MIIYDQVQQVPLDEEPPVEKKVIRVTIPEEKEIIPEFEGKTFEKVFTVNKIDDIIYNRINTLSYKENDYIEIEDLRYLKVSYWGFDNKRHYGELIVHASLAQEVIDIFKDLYDAKYPIEKIKLVDEYQADDNLSMIDNNSSAFNFRYIAGSKKLSNHAFGMAIDINPLQNPYVSSSSVQPLEGERYADRSLDEKGMIQIGDACYEAFTSRGWTWGGEWKSIKDYQHFEKNTNEN
ncbi:M15 family metallopeptidase [Acidaminobacter sp. JC074]|nr:M15 family metallopeptidase [Acidaminobacter sp. JC074]